VGGFDSIGCPSGETIYSASMTGQQINAMAKCDYFFTNNASEAV
jgi:hypothetical protein